MQDYLGSENLTKEEMTMVTSIRSMCVKGIRRNFKNMHKVCLHCPLECSTESLHEDTQDHVLRCSKLGQSTVDINFMYASSVEQGLLAREFLERMTTRTTLLEDQPDLSSCCRPGAILDPSSQGAPATVVPIL